MIGRKNWSPQNRVPMVSIKDVSTILSPLPTISNKTNFFIIHAPELYEHFGLHYMKKTCLTNQLAQWMYWICNFWDFLGHPIFGGLKITGGDSMFYMFYLLKVFLTTICSRFHLQYMNGSIFKMMSSPETRKPTRKPMVLSPKNVVGRLGTDSFSSSLRQWEYHLPHLAPWDRGDSVFEGSCKEPFWKLGPTCNLYSCNIP